MNYSVYVYVRPELGIMRQSEKAFTVYRSVVVPQACHVCDYSHKAKSNIQPNLHLYELNRLAKREMIISIFILPIL